MNVDATLLMADREQREAALHQAKNIARAELARRRRRLGELTPEQEIGVENLLMSTVSKILEVAGDVLDSLPLARETGANQTTPARVIP